MVAIGSSQLEKLKGTVRRITFRSIENGFTVLRLEPGAEPGSSTAPDRNRLGSSHLSEGEKSRGASAAGPLDGGLWRALPGGWSDRESVPYVTVVGYLPGVPEGEMIEVAGNWTTHPRYGRQFQAESFQVVAPDNELGLRRYLASGLVKGVGPATAERLVAHFGVDTLEVIEKHPERLSEVPGIGPKKAAAIHRGFVRRRSVEQVMIFLQGHGVSPAYAARIYKEYGDAAISIVRENPYRLARDVFGIGFRMADRLAQALGVDESSPQRLQAGLLYTLDRSASEGHVYLPRRELSVAAARELGIGEEEAEVALSHLLAEGRLVVRPSIGRLEGRIDADPGEDAIFRPELDRAEGELAERLAQLASFFTDREEGRLLGAPTLDIDDSPSALGAVRHAAEEANLSLTPEQEKAVLKGLEAGVLVITGGPGTGKTTIVRVLLSLLKRLKQKVLMACPTGRAAQRLAEATGEKAQTVHRMLEFGYEEGRGLVFQRHEGNPLEADVVLIDEASMLDIWLAHHVVRALRSGTRLILVGDIDQLPSVGPGNVLRDIIAAGSVETVRLHRIFRQEEDSGIVEAAHAVLAGREPVLNRTDGDFFLLEESEPEQIAEVIVDLVERRIPAYLGCDPVNDIQVLSPMRRTQTGVERLNALLQQRLNPSGGDEGALRSRDEDEPAGPNELAATIPFHIGDKVMQTRNNYRKRVFNGDIGRVVAADGAEAVLRVAYPSPEGLQLVEYDDSDWDELTLAYCISVHKSQGSEYPAIVLPVTTQHYVMLRRNLLYTAMTRAKRMAVLVGTRRALRLAVANASEERRYSLLSYRLRQAAAGFQSL